MGKPGNKHILVLSAALLILSSGATVYSTPEQIPAVSAADPTPAVDTMKIDRGWSLRRIGDSRRIPAAVPGCVHTDLLAAGVIPDPFSGDNHERLRWIEKCRWEYVTDFVPAEEIVARDNIRILFEGIDTFAEIYLNGEHLLSTDNMFRSWSVEAAELINRGRNTLRVVFSPPIEASGADTMPRLPGGERVYIRKAAYQFGWDWAPRILTCGIWRPVYLTGWNRGRIDGVRIVQREINNERALLAVETSLEIGERRDYQLLISDRSGEVRYRKDAGRLEAGITTVGADIRIEDPRLWWTSGLGEQNLYDISVILISGRSVLDRKDLRIGLREIELVTDPDGAGSSFFFRLNGVPVYMKGANYVPQDIFPSRVPDSSYAELIGYAREMNMNMLRVWGGGIYERDIFYDLCDENGILVWQDFMFACGMYPYDDDFLDNAAEEAAGVIRRLRNHCSVALWCGNNESDEGWHNWGWQRRFGYSPGDSAAIWNGYRELFHRVLPEAVSRLDGTRDYVPTSPKFGRGDPRSLTEGDFHNWWVWHDGRPFQSYRHQTGRFMSEFGFQSFPAAETVESFVPEGRMAIGSAAIEAHQMHPRGNGIIREYMKRYYQVPEELKDFIYTSQLLQAAGIRTGIEAQRTAAPFCMGSLLWQFNDCWPAISFSAVDYFGRWKALAYSVRGGFADIVVSPVVEGDTVKVYAASGRLDDTGGELELRTVGFEGELLRSERRRISLGRNRGGLYYSAPLEEVIDGGAKERTALVCLFHEPGGVWRKIMYFAPPKELSLPEPGIEYSISGQGREYIIKLRAENLVKNLYLELESADAHFSDNYFDMLPGEERKIKVRTGVRLEQAADKFRYRSLR
jgi:beta-mannosidase